MTEVYHSYVSRMLGAQGVLGQVVPQVRQMYERLPRASAAADADARFEHFRSQIWPRIQEAGSSGGPSVCHLLLDLRPWDLLVTVWPNYALSIFAFGMVHLRISLPLAAFALFLLAYVRCID